jgi:glucose/arabinose dehydrogenase
MLACCIIAKGRYNPPQMNTNFSSRSSVDPVLSPPAAGQPLAASRARPPAYCAWLIVLAVAFAFSARAGTGIALKKVAEGFVSPVVLVPLGDSGQLLVADQVGTVRVLNKDGALSDTAFLDVRSKLIKLNDGFDERGLLGLALHPRFKENHKLYVFYSAPLRKGAPGYRDAAPGFNPNDPAVKDTNAWDHTAHVSEFKVTEKNPLQVDLASERVLLEIDKPYFNHNSGRLVFGPDGYLYIAVGDGGNMNDVGRGHSPQGNGQDTAVLLAKILRIDIDQADPGKPYAIPADNPFARGKGRPEIFAYGIRNPWGISFDRGGKHELFSADVGQDSFEEVNIIVKGGNYGWNLREGFVCFNPKDSLHPPADCAKVGANGEPLLDPIVAYKNFKRFPRDPEARGTSITGGYVYRGKALPQLQGRYVFADWSRNWAVPLGTLYVATRPVSGQSQVWSMDTVDIVSHPKGIGAYVVALGEDADGELYLLTNNSNSLLGKTGKVWKLVAAE